MENTKSVKQVEKEKAKARKKAEKEKAKARKKAEKEKAKAIKISKETCKRISKMAMKSYSNFKAGFDSRQNMRDEIEDRKTKGIMWCLIASVMQMLSLPYFKNEAAASGKVHNTPRHEDAIARALKDNGFIKYPLSKSLNKKETEKWIDNPELSRNIPDGTFIEQPCGTHSSPDFIVKVSNKLVLFLEAKSSETTHPTYNSGGVKQHILYVFCSKKTNETTIFKGSSIITLKQQRLIDEHIIEARKRDEELNAKLAAIDPNHRGMSYYTRPMIIQSGGESYTNYFTHANRKRDENDALEWIKNNCEL
jgi:hypothetical protein